MGAQPQPCYNKIRAINDHIIMRLQCTISRRGSVARKLSLVKIPIPNHSTTTV